MSKYIERDLNKDSSPGYPFNQLAPNNGKLFEKHGGFVWSTVCSSFNQAIRFGDKVFDMNPQQLVENGICDPVKVFIKEEPHSMKKILAGKLRIISSVSIRDQIKTRLLCSLQNQHEIAMWERCPGKPGMGLHDDGLEVISALFSSWLNKYGSVLETDVSGWDWSVKDWELFMDAEQRVKLAGAKPNGLFAFLVRVHAHCVANSVYVTPDGDMFSQVIPGAQLSGDYNTSSTNGHMRVIATLVARLWGTGRVLCEHEGKYEIGVAAMGDDSVEVETPGIQEGLELIGHSVKLVKPSTTLEGVEFCSQVFKADGFAYPSDASKTVFRFTSHKSSDIHYPEWWAQLSWYLRHLDPNGELGSIREIAEARVARAKRLNGEEWLPQHKELVGDDRDKLREPVLEALPAMAVGAPVKV